MKFVSVIQHTQSEWLGGVEDHLEGRGVRFGYFRPFAAGGKLPDLSTLGDGLILVGGGPWGAITPDRLLPTLDREVRLARACLMLEKPVAAFGLGAQILSLAAEGTATQAPLSLEIATQRRTRAGALGGLLPQTFKAATYMRDWPAPPAYAHVLAVDPLGRPAVFQIGKNAFGFAAHPGIRRAMLEDLIMEFDETPADTAAGLEAMSLAQTSIDDALVPIMAGLIAATEWMNTASSA